MMIPTSNGTPKATPDLNPAATSSNSHSGYAFGRPVTPPSGRLAFSPGGTRTPDFFGDDRRGITSGERSVVSNTPRTSSLRPSLDIDPLPQNATEEQIIKYLDTILQQIDKNPELKDMIIKAVSHEAMLFLTKEVRDPNKKRDLEKKTTESVQLLFTFLVNRGVASIDDFEFPDGYDDLGSNIFKQLVRILSQQMVLDKSSLEQASSYFVDADSEARAEYDANLQSLAAQLDDLVKARDEDEILFSKLKQEYESSISLSAGAHSSSSASAYSSPSAGAYSSSRAGAYSSPSASACLLSSSFRTAGDFMPISASRVEKKPLTTFSRPDAATASVSWSTTQTAQSRPGAGVNPLPDGATDDEIIAYLNQLLKKYKNDKKTQDHIVDNVSHDAGVLASRGIESLQDASAIYDKASSHTRENCRKGLERVFRTDDVRALLNDMEITDKQGKQDFDLLIKAVSGFDEDKSSLQQVNAFLLEKLTKKLSDTKAARTEWSDDSVTMFTAPVTGRTANAFVPIRVSNPLPKAHPFVSSRASGIQGQNSASSGYPPLPGYTGLRPSTDNGTATRTTQSRRPVAPRVSTQPMAPGFQSRTPQAAQRPFVAQQGVEFPKAPKATKNSTGAVKNRVRRGKR